MKCSVGRPQHATPEIRLSTGFLLLLAVLQWMSLGCGGGCGTGKGRFQQEVELPNVLAVESLQRATSTSHGQVYPTDPRHGSGVTGCALSSDCDDGQPCTEDRCVWAECRHLEIPSSDCCIEGGIFLSDYDVDVDSNLVTRDSPVHDVGWKVSNQRALSAPNSLYFGNPETLNYAAPAAVKGDALSAPVDIPLTGEAELRFAVMALISPHPGHDFFTVSVDILNDDLELISQQSLLDKSDFPASAYTGFSWVLVSITNLKGKKIRLRFSFDSLIVASQGHEGIYIDDVEVAVRCATLKPCDHDLDCDDGQGCTLDVCSAAGCVHDALCEDVSEDDATDAVESRRTSTDLGPDARSALGLSDESGDRNDDESSWRSEGGVEVGAKGAKEDRDSDFQLIFSSKEKGASDHGESVGTKRGEMPSAAGEQNAQGSDGMDETGEDAGQSESDGKADAAAGQQGSAGNPGGDAAEISGESNVEDGAEPESESEDESTSWSQNESEEGLCEAMDASADCCTSDEDCDDGSDWTIDVCEGASCVSTPNPDACVIDGDCEDGEPCTIDRCDQGLCQYEGVFGSICCQVQDEPLFDFDFGALGGLYVTDNTESGVFWSVDKTRSTSGLFSLYCGDPKPQTYQTGVHVKSSATTPLMEVPAGGFSYVAFDLFTDTRKDKDYDVLQVFVLRDGALLPAWSSKTMLMNNDDNVFHPVIISLQDYAGQLIQLRFVFDSVDGSSGVHEGVYVDSVRLETECD